jgi:hypothetical protein
MTAYFLNVGYTIHKIFNKDIIRPIKTLFVCWVFVGLMASMETKRNSQLLKIAPPDGSNKRHFNAHFRWYYC